MKLPNGERAIIADEKLDQYCLSPDHDEGHHKAYLFSKLLGFDRSNQDQLRSLLREIIETEEVAFTRPNEYGMLYYVDTTIVRPERTFRFRSIWIIRQNEDFPRLVSCYLKRRKAPERRRT
ncbi:MAG: hypothetical protein Q8922_14295 [Bacteroidota bacterium]|nr:hypothetical protein [Bacteroidota bacterium]MDP4234329.1 hypothetical protein [Bacteroidota bacterium]MDP4243263.1 hypothetical protein [Bacteroidota bacterium]MDP4289088.1 hypothetical protein [Bacteroidota bacterium]